MTPHVSITLLRTQTDERLIELIAAGHDRAFDAVVDRYRRPLLRYARRFVSEDGRAEDVVQAAFLSAWTALREGTPVRDLRPWLYRIVHNGALNVMKKPGGEDAPLIEASDLRPGPAAEVEQREDVRRALDTIAALPERQRAALLAVALEGRSHADVGEDLGLNDTAVRQLVSRARTSLRVAATAITPWPAAVWLAGAGAASSGETAARVGELVGGGVVGGGALKAGAVIAAAGAVAVSVPQVSHVVHVHRRPANAAAAQIHDGAPVRDGALTISAGSPGTSGSAPAQVGGRSGTTRVVVTGDRHRGSAGHGGGRRHPGIAPVPQEGEDRGGPPAGGPGPEPGRSGHGENGSDGHRHGSDAAPRPQSGRAPSEHSGPGEGSPEPADDHQGGEPAAGEATGESRGTESGSAESGGSGRHESGSGSGTDVKDPAESPEPPEVRGGHGGEDAPPVPGP